jgi:hypothetical protein
MEARREQVIDWIDDLVEFGPTAVADACREWRRDFDRRPTPANIRRLCIAAQNRRREDEMRRLPPPPPPPEPEPMSAADRAHCVAVAERALRRLRHIPPESQPTGYGAVEHRKAREYTPDEMRAGRIDLGLEATEGGNDG